MMAYRKSPLSASPEAVAMNPGFGVGPAVIQFFLTVPQTDVGSNVCIKQDDFPFSNLSNLSFLVHLCLQNTNALSELAVT